MSSTLDEIAKWTAEALEPAALALAGGESDALAMLRELGYDLQTLPAPIVALAPPTSTLLDALDVLLLAIEQQRAEETATNAYLTAAGLLTVAIIQVVTSLDQLQSSGLPAGVAPAELARRLVDMLVIRALDRRGRKLASIMRLLGIIDVELVDAVPAGDEKLPIARLETERIVKVISEPAELARVLYGWGTPLFDAQKLFDRIIDVALAFNRDFRFAGIDVSVANLAGVSLADPDPVLLIPLITDPVGLDVILLGVPAAGTKLPGLGLTLQLSAAGSTDIPLSQHTKLVLAGSGSLSGGLLLIARPGELEARFDLLGAVAASSASASLTLVRSPASGEDRVQLLNVLDEVVLDAVEARVGVGASVAGSSQDVFAELELKQGRLAVGMGKADGFLAKMLPEGGLQLPLALHITWSKSAGLRFEGGAGLTIRSTEHRELGPISIELIEVTITLGTTGIQARGTLDAKLKLGPLVAVVEKIGAKADLSFKKGNIGPADIAIGFKPPAGAGLSINAGPVTGGGYLFFDPENEQYAGVLQLSFKAINVVAIGLLTTRLPDATAAPGVTKKGFSLLVIIAAEFPPIQLGYGFSLTGVGGLLGVNRTMVVEALRSGVKNRTVDSILFPTDPIARATQIISDLRSIFPPAEGRFIFGPMVKIGWGPNSIIEIEAALVLELMAPIRLVILGRIQAALPDKKDPVLKLRLDIVGVIDFDRSEASVDASLVDSKLTVFVLTGDMAMRVAWGATKTFVLAAGGFNRRFLPPPGFPALDRLGIALADSDNPRLRLGSYLALTPNTIQFGAEIDIYAKTDTLVGVFSISALATFDAMIQFQPIEFRADISATIDIARNSVPFLHAALCASFSGPNPWHAIGYAEFDFFGKHRIDVEATAGSPLVPPEMRISVSDLANELIQAIARTDTWAALPPPDGSKLVSLRDVPTAGTIAVHPLGTLTIRQRVLPLGKIITRFGAAVVDPVSFDLAGIGIGASAARNMPGSEDATQDEFAPGQFAVLTDDEKLARPAFETMRSGANVKVLATGLPSDAPAGIGVGIQYEESIVDVEPTSGKRSVQPIIGRTAASQSIPLKIIGELAKAGAAAYAQTGTSGADEFAGVDRPIVVSGERYVTAGADNLVVATGTPASGMSCAEAHDRMAKKTVSGEPLEVALLHEAA